MAQWGLRGPLPPPASHRIFLPPHQAWPDRAREGWVGRDHPSLPTPVTLDAIVFQGQSLLQLPLTLNLMKCVTSKPSFLHGPL